MKVSETASARPVKPRGKWPRSVRVGSVEVKIYRVSPKGVSPYFQIADYSHGARRLRSIASESKALEEARRLARSLAKGEVGAAQLTHSQAASFARAIDFLEPTGDPIELAAARYA